MTTPSRVSRSLPGYGVVRFRLGTGNAASRRYRVAVLDKLLAGGQVEVVLGLRDGRFTWRELLAADREGRLLEAADLLALRGPLWEAVERVFASQDRLTRRYAVGFTVLRRLNLPELRGTPSVVQLARVDWAAAYQGWTMSAAHWNHMRRAVSKLCTRLTYRGHPFWGRLKARFPVAQEVPRLVDLTLEDLTALKAHLPPWSWAAVVLLATTGLRWGEYAALTERDVSGGVIRVRKGKTRAATRVVPVPDPVWDLVRSAVPCPVTYDGWRVVWERGRKAAGLTRVRTHDLRHVAIQLWLDAGWAVADVQTIVGHRYSRQTLDYARRSRLSERARVLAPDLSGFDEPTARPPETKHDAGRGVSHAREET